MTELIRTASKADIADLARIHVASKKAAYAGIVDQEFLDAKTQEQYEEKWTRWISEDDITLSILEHDGVPVGFISYGKMQTPPPGTSKIRPLYTAEIFAIHIHPDHWRHGFGLQLIQHACANLKENKHRAVCLWVLEKNDRAVKFYQKLEGARLGKRVVEVGRSKPKELCYGWRDISVITSR